MLLEDKGREGGSRALNTHSYLKQCNEKKKGISSSPELGIEEPRQECDNVVFCSAKREELKTHGIKGKT